MLEEADFTEVISPVAESITTWPATGSEPAPERMTVFICPSKLSPMVNFTRPTTFFRLSLPSLPTCPTATVAPAALGEPGTMLCVAGTVAVKEVPSQEMNDEAGNRAGKGAVASSATKPSKVAVLPWLVPGLMLNMLRSEPSHTEMSSPCCHLTSGKAASVALEPAKEAVNSFATLSAAGTGPAFSPAGTSFSQEISPARASPAGSKNLMRCFIMSKL